MEKYFESDGLSIYHGDCRDVVEKLGQFDLVVADPPYNETNLEWDVWPSGWVRAVRDRLLPHGSMWCFGSMRMWWRDDVRGELDDWQMSQDLVWEKHNGSGARNDRFLRVHESPIHFYPKSQRWEHIYKKTVYTLDAVKKTAYRRKGPAHFTPMKPGYYQTAEGGPRLMRSVLFARSCHGHAINETEKPVRILAPLLDYSCKPGGVVLDPFMGSGSTLEACYRLGFHAIGVEKRE